MDRRDDDSAVLLIRVWREGDGVRARLLTQPAPGEAEGAVVAGSAEAIVEAVRAWLREFEARSAPVAGTPESE